ncbi:response regulator receiver domain [Aeromonas mytilicola subsp. aquatica]|uniref:response regulator receiver domain n=1 Tax=Aeromonas mytilicola TaxID=3377113 RepID=UPI0037BECA30
MTNNSYRELVKKAFIEPIKSVLAIDDQYKSLDLFLIDQQGKPSDNNQLDISRQRQTLEMVRAKCWLADMHDGHVEATGDQLYSRLHQCDLLLLDYHLDPTEHSDATKALNILSIIDKNHHFNLAVVYTSDEDLKKVQREIFFKLSSFSALDFTNQDFTCIEEVINTWSDNGVEILDELIDNISNDELFQIIKKPDILKTDVFNAIFNQTRTVLNNYYLEIPHEIDERIFYLYLLKCKSSILNKNGEFNGSSNVQTNSSDSETIWLKTNRSFISIVSKSNVTPSELPDALLSALENWSPTSHRLLLSRIKSELDDNGQTFESSVLKCIFTNAGWLKQFSESSNGYQLTVSRLMEGLKNSLLDSHSLKDFSNLLKQHINSISLNETIDRESNSSIKLSNESDRLNVFKLLNSYIGTKKVDGEHLVTGHIIKWTKPNNQHEMLLCLTPACDLVPGRTAERGWKTDLAPSFLPVKIIRLLKQDNERKYLKEINSKPVLVLTTDENTSVYLAAESGKSVFHEQIFAMNQGRFTRETNNVMVKLVRTQLQNEDQLITVPQDCHVVGQLRYEYALNLLQLLGQDLTKIGLDFVKFE